ncbi:MAG: hypothetical protein D6747_03550 [Chlorobiota bacterium]|jgi:hypothetical protein|nr:MAG: hypothetical protein D6747_03550 [Chlorobiota bacterium]
MHASDWLQPPLVPETLLAELDRLGTELDSALAALMNSADTASPEQRAAAIERIASVLATRGTVLDAFGAWLQTSRSARATARGRHHWQEALERLQQADTRRAEQLGALLADAGTQLQQRIAQRALFIYQRGTP